MNVSSNIRAAKKKNSDAWSPKILASDTKMTMMFPNATVRSQNAWRTDFMLVGAWLQENSNPDIRESIGVFRSISDIRLTCH